MKERRLYPARTAKVMPVFFSDAEQSGEAFEAETINLAANGLYCKVKKPIPLYTKLSCTLVYPLNNKGETKCEERKSISIEGVVVRCDLQEGSNNAKEYNVAVFFGELDENDRKELKKLISE